MSPLNHSSSSPSLTPEMAASSRVTALWARVAVGLLMLSTIAVAARWLWPAVSPARPAHSSFAEGHALPTSAPPVAGQPAPDFEMAYPDGRRMRLSDWRGQPVLINFWATWCGPCRVEIPELIKAYEAHRQHGLVILAVNVQESAHQVQPFVDELGLSFPVVLDLDGEISRQYQVRSLPSSIFVGRDGLIAARWVGILSPEQLWNHLERIL
ncbi:MAG: TlpA family protein disulfide reductase [Anaerolineae bacterium]|nr:TlpA family protein disulfide reductase [Anaerolineae bacterium]MDW8099436.1 TlpA family protein disulfide reductase [Anaerolineae bacterium]